MSITRSGSISRGMRFAAVRISAGSASAASRPRKLTRTSRAAAISSLIRASSRRPSSAEIDSSGKSSRPLPGSMFPPVTGMANSVHTTPQSTCRAVCVRMSR